MLQSGDQTTFVSLNTRIIGSKQLSKTTGFTIIEPERIHNPVMGEMATRQSCWCKGGRRCRCDCEVCEVSRSCVTSRLPEENKESNGIKKLERGP